MSVCVSERASERAKESKCVCETEETDRGERGRETSESERAQEREERELE